MLLQDDLIDEMGSFIAAADLLRERGAYKIYIVATHGLLSSDAPQQIEESVIDEVSDIVLQVVVTLSYRL